MSSSNGKERISAGEAPIAYDSEEEAAAATAERDAKFRQAIARADTPSE